MDSFHISSEQISALTQVAYRQGHVNEAVLSAFMQAYHRHILNASIVNYRVQDLAGMALNHFQLLQNSLIAHAPKLAVFNTDSNVDFDSEHTIVQLAAVDKPFLTDTILMTLEEAGIVVHRIHTAILKVRANDAVSEVSAATVSNQDTMDGTTQMALVHCEINRQDEDGLIKISDLLFDKLNVLNVIVDDFSDMKARLQHVKQQLAGVPFPTEFYSRDEVLNFLDWIGDNNFIFMGFREYRFDEDLSEPKLYSVGNSGLGVLRGDVADARSESFHRLPMDLKKRLTEPRVLVFSKSGHAAPVHRAAFMDFLGIQKFDDKGKLIGEYRFLGLLTSRAYQTSLERIPLLREKAQSILARTLLPKNSHAYNKMAHIINTLPRDDVFQATPDELYGIATGIANLQDKNKLKLFTRIDPYQRFVSCLVYVPRHKFNSQLRQKIQQVLLDCYEGVSLGFSTEYDESSHARLHVHVRTVPGRAHIADDKQVENKLSELLSDWQDDYKARLNQVLGVSQSDFISRDVLPNIPASYQERFGADEAVIDSQMFAKLVMLADDELLWNLYQDKHHADDALSLKVYGKKTAADLSTVLPILENFGVSVVTADSYTFGGVSDNLWLQDYTLKPKNVSSIDLSVVKAQFESALSLIKEGKIESDKLNELILTTELSAMDVVVLRALSRYMIQAKAPFSSDYIHQTLINNPALSVLIVQLFHAKFDPNTHSPIKADSVLSSINSALNAITSLDEDRIVRWLLDLIAAMVRTNFYQTDAQGNKKDRISFKFLASEIPYLPKPKPMFEIFVYSPRTEGVHLRGGKVARGGLRWSDRMEDYRTEVLGLVKAQMVKNSVIVPVGSKGGFVVKDKSMQADRDAWQKEGIACYQTFVRGLLDLTDNLVDGRIVPPANTVRHDKDDPYLVVAADKGTATFSDIANGLSAEYNFWLQDAFASGGSAGYDHKGMGITARGAWESVKRHFRLMNKDIQNTDDTNNQFSVVGIGDMSGDVFGNGMLLSQNIQLVAAFNHLHIFIDPNPDPKASFVERERLFKLPRSAWTDYNKDLIGQSGGVFSRSDKAIAITEPMKKRFDIQEDSLTPNELLNRLLKAPVDLIWNGGIGTYIKSSDEEHFEVGDRANDAIRVNGSEVRAKVVGEGGNLGCTQRGRIEYAQHGGRIYTDAIDNSGGVNCSDHEVNIKILLGAVVERAQMDLMARNELLASMTDDVANLVLRQNYLQPQAIELSVFHAAKKLGDHARFMQFLESKGRLDRAIEYLPSEEVIAARHKKQQGLTNPEFAVLLSYGKMWVYDEMLSSDLPDNPYFLDELKKYFPKVLGERFFEDMIKHRLHREIICTYLTNGIVNRLGLENIFALHEELGQSISNITHAYAIVRDVFDIQVQWDALIALDNIIAAHTQLEIESDIRESFKNAIAWLLSNNADVKDAKNLTQAFKTSIKTLIDNPDVFDVHFKDDVIRGSNALVAEGVLDSQAKLFATFPVLVKSLDVVALSDGNAAGVDKVAKAYFGVAKAVLADELKLAIDSLPINSYWDKKAIGALNLQLNETLNVLSENAINQGFDEWQQMHADKIASFVKEMAYVKKDLSLASLSVLLSELNKLKA